MKPTLRIWSRGPHVKVLQEGLNTALPQLLPPLTADGIFGEKTLARVRELQAWAKVTVDGIVGPETWRILGDVLAGALGQAVSPAVSPAVDIRPLTPIGGLKSAPAESAWTPVEASLTSEYAFSWTSVGGGGTISYFELAEKVVPKWFGVLVPNGVERLDRVHLFFHPTPGQAGYNDAQYHKLGDWWKIWHYLSDPMGTQFCAAGTDRILIMPLMTGGSAQTCGVLPARWASIFGHILASLGSNPASPVTITSMVVSSFSSGISYSHYFRKNAGLGSTLAGVIDFDGAFSLSKHLSAMVVQPAGRVVRVSQLPTATKLVAGAAAANVFPVPQPRWKHSPWPKANAYQIHGLIPQSLMFTAAKRAG